LTNFVSHSAGDIVSQVSGRTGSILPLQPNLLRYPFEGQLNFITPKVGLASLFGERSDRKMVELLI
jgi:hypothetical protein